jgi:hypothetical protein
VTGGETFPLVVCPVSIAGGSQELGLVFKHGFWEQDISFVGDFLLGGGLSLWEPNNSGSSRV